VTVTVDVLDRVTRVAPLGVRFWDPVVGAVVRDGLEVTLYPTGSPQLRVLAQPNPSGVYVLHSGPGLGRAATGAGDADYWQHIPETRDYRCAVRDTQSRYQPVAFNARLPFEGLLQVQCASPSPPVYAQGIELFSAPTRAVPSAMAIIRAELTRASTGRPAAWAMLTVEFAGAFLGRGVADEKGRIAAIFPYPEPERRPRQSPPESLSPPQPSALMTWEVEVRVHHSPALAGTTLPDLCDVLMQPEARLFTSSPPEELRRTTVVLGRESYLAKSRVLVAPV